MSFIPSGFYDFSLWLMSQRTDEACRRTAISRIYYAAHLTARDRLSSKGWLIPTGKGDDHSHVIRELRTRRFRDRANELLYLKDLREHSDYHTSSARSSLNESCQICEEVSDSKQREVVTAEHWREAMEVAGQLIPLLAKI